MGASGLYQGLVVLPGLSEVAFRVRVEREERAAQDARLRDRAATLEAAQEAIARRQAESLARQAALDRLAADNLRLAEALNRNLARRPGD